MRALALLLPVLVAGCAAPQVAAPSLAPRAAEAIDPRVPVPEPVISAVPDPQLVDLLESLIAQARAGDSAFRAVIDDARRLAEIAGPPQSESWIAAQQSLSNAIAARGPVTGAMGDIDSLAAERIVAAGAVGKANLSAIEAAAARVAEIDDRQARIVSELQARLRG